MKQPTLDVSKPVTFKVIGPGKKYLREVSKLSTDVFKKSSLKENTSIYAWNFKSKSFIGIVALQKGHVVGFCIGISSWTQFTECPKEDKPSMKHDYNKWGFGLKTTYFLRDIAIRKDFRNQGIGQKLITRFVKAVKKTRRYDKVFFDTNNPTLVKAFKKTKIDLIEMKKVKTAPRRKRFYFQV